MPYGRWCFWSHCGLRRCCWLLQCLSVGFWTAGGPPRSVVGAVGRLAGLQDVSCGGIFSCCSSPLPSSPPLLFATQKRRCCLNSFPVAGVGTRRSFGLRLLLRFYLFASSLARLLLPHREFCGLHGLFLTVVLCCEICWSPGLLVLSCGPVTVVRWSEPAIIIIIIITQRCGAVWCFALSRLDIHRVLSVVVFA